MNHEVIIDGKTYVPKEDLTLSVTESITLPWP